MEPIPGNQKTYNYTYLYDNYKRLINTIEDNDLAHFEKQVAYDSYGNVYKETYISNNKSNNVSSTVKIRNIYNNAGIVYEIQNFDTSESLWKLVNENEKGNPTEITLGNGLTKSRQYNQFGFLTQINDYNPSTSTYVLKLDYDFDAQTGNLNSRKNHGFNWLESFTYDNLDRLVTINGPISFTQNYDNRGRISDNSTIGQYNYSTTNRYRLNDIVLNTPGNSYYQSHTLQQIKYNAFKKPVEIFEEGKGRVNFEYGPLGNRSQAYYGGLNENKLQRNFYKHYSAITPVEIVENKTDNSTKIITYIGGNAYTAPIAYIKNTKAGSSNGYHYLHRDYLGSILTITDANGIVKEQRQFGAWGVVDKFVGSNGNTTFDESSLITRGYTGHEHFFEVGLIHMNGRMYDAKLGKFLSPDNYIQEPFNTQNYNRYGYVWNNPLKYTDPDGEFLVAALIGAAISVLTNGINNTIHGRGFFKGALNSAIFGAIGGALSYGIGELASSMYSNLISSGVSNLSSSIIVGGFQAGSHALLGGTLSVVQGGKFKAGALSGALSSIVASGVGNLNTSSKLWNSIIRISASGLSGGIGSVIGGGKFIDGVRQGLISGGLNHGVHAGWFGEGIAIASITQRVRHIFGPDGFIISATANISGILSTEIEGGVIRVRTKFGVITKPIAEVGVGLGWIEASVNGGITKLYHSGKMSNIRFDDYLGTRFEGNISVNAVISFGASISYSRVQGTNNFVLGTSSSFGIGVSPTIVSGYMTYGASGTSLRGVRETVRKNLGIK